MPAGAAGASGPRPAYLAYTERVLERFHRYEQSETWYSQHYGDREYGTIAYFSAEFGLHESLPIYSGGLGVLAGDHLKSASDLACRWWAWVCCIVRDTFTST